LLPAAAQQKDTVLVHFEFNRSEITTVAAAILDSLVSATRAGRLQQIKLFGHWDFIGSDSYNDSLSQSRIISVKEYLLQKNLPEDIFSSERIKDSAVQSSLILENLNFEGGRHFLLPESMPILDELLKALQNNPTVLIEIQGYVCCTEVNADGLDLDLQTQDLSVQRAKAIYNFLIEKGIDAKRLRYQGFGGSRKIYPYEQDEFERSKNRRVEIKILSK
jgi:outer membrane protein OmpA-like peptidoglycan-associated protein